MPKLATRSISAKTSSRKRAIKTTPGPVSFRVFDGLEKHLQKRESVTWRLLWKDKLLTESLKDKIASKVKEYKSGKSSSLILRSPHYRGKTLDGRIDRCPPACRGVLLQRSLEGKKYVFTLNMGKKETRLFLDSSKGFTHLVRVELNKAIKNKLGYLPKYFFFIEIGSVNTRTRHGLVPKSTGHGTLHLHGIIEADAYSLRELKSGMESISSFTGKKTFFGQPVGNFKTSLMFAEMRRRGIKIPGDSDAADSKITSEDREAYIRAIKAYTLNPICLSSVDHDQQDIREDYSWACYMTKDHKTLKDSWDRSKGKLGQGWAVSHQEISDRAQRLLWVFKQLLEI